MHRLIVFPAYDTFPSMFPRLQRGGPQSRVLPCRFFFFFFFLSDDRFVICDKWNRHSHSYEFTAPAFEQMDYRHKRKISRLYSRDEIKPVELSRTDCRITVRIRQNAHNCIVRTPDVSSEKLCKKETDECGDFTQCERRRV